jgi:hypothetical protein
MATPIASEVKILKTKAAAKKGLGVAPGETESVWPKPEFVSASPNFLPPSRVR